MRLFAVLRAVVATLVLVAAPAAAQDYASLVADRVMIRADRELVAEGNVVVVWRDTRLGASKVIYDSADESLRIEGPITLVQGDGTLMTAEAAELSRDMRDGLLRSARLVLERQLQMAAAEIRRVEGRYTTLDQVVATSCQVCPGNPVPLWSIRARRIVHDQEERQLYFEGAQLRVMGLPVAYLPRLRLPDPTLDRATGFLFPELRTTSARGTGIKVPYFIVMGPSTDLTLEPYLSSNTTTLNWRYRRMFTQGAAIFEGAFTRDDTLPGETRGYLFGAAGFTLPADYRLGVKIEAVSDDGYLLDYDISDADRLETGMTLSRVRRDELIELGASVYRTMRDDEIDAEVPTAGARLRFERRFEPPLVGGTARLRLGGLAAYRSSDLDAVGRDVARLDAFAGWNRSEVFGPGIVATASIGVQAVAYGINQDASYGETAAELRPEAGVTLRWPLLRSAGDGATDVVEPFAMLTWTRAGTTDLPNEDSTLVELDEGNLLSFSRFPGVDRYEPGASFVLGASWTRYSPGGTMRRLTLGRIFRDRDRGAFGPDTGLEGESSDWLIGMRLDLPERLSISGRALVDDALSASKIDLKASYLGERLTADAGFTFLSASVAENRPQEVSEFLLDGSWAIDRNWTAQSGLRYDASAGRATAGNLGLVFSNECVNVALSLSRRFTSSTSVDPETNFSLSVELTGFGTGGQGGVPRRRCVN